MAERKRRRTELQPGFIGDKHLLNGIPGHQAPSLFRPRGSGSGSPRFAGPNDAAEWLGYLFHLLGAVRSAYDHEPFRKLFFQARLAELRRHLNSVDDRDLRELNGILNRRFKEVGRALKARRRDIRRHLLGLGA